MSDKFDTSTLRKRLKGTHRLLFAAGATIANYATIGLRDIGNVVDLGIQPNTEKFEDFDMIGGRKVPLPPDYLSQITDFNVKVNDLGRDNLKLMLRGEDSTAIAQAALETEAIDELDFSVDDPVEGLYYQLTNNGEAVYSITAITIDDGEEPVVVELVEGADFELIPAVGLIRFTAAGVAKATGLVLNITVTAEAFSATPFEVGRAAPVDGIGMILTHVQKHSQINPAFILKPFGCYIEYEEALTITADANAESTLKVRVTNPVPEFVDFRS